MSEQATDQNLTDADAELPENVENSEIPDDTSIRSLLTAELDAETPPEADDNGDDEPGAETPTEEAAAEALAPPQSWTAAEREAWAEMSEAAQHAVIRREQDMQAALRSDAALSKVIEPLAERLQGTGVHVDQFVGALVQADQAIRQNPHAAIMQLIQQHGLPPQLETYDRDESDPALSEVQRLRAELAREREVQRASDEWQKFQAEHADAEKLKGLMASALQQNPQLDYAGAYAEAKALLKQASGSSETSAAEAIEKQAGQAEKARRLKLPSGRASAPSEPESTGDLREDLRRAMKQAGIMR